MKTTKRYKTIDLCLYTRLIPSPPISSDTKAKEGDLYIAFFLSITFRALTSPGWLLRHEDGWVPIGRVLCSGL